MVDNRQVELRDISPRAILLLGAGFAGFIAVAASGLLLFFQPDLPWTFNRLAKPAPRLQISPASDYAAFLEQKRAMLVGYGWSDRDAGLVTIPIEEAMHLVSEGHRAAVGNSAKGAPDCRGAACPDATPTAKTIR